MPVAYNCGVNKAKGAAKKGMILDDHGAPVSYNWLADFMYAGIDGAVSAFVVVAGVRGASLSPSIVLILGFASLFAGGFSMAVGKYSSDKAKLEQYEKIEKIEFEHLKKRPSGEIKEVREIMAGYGFKGKDLDRATKVITSDPEKWVDLMMRNEFNMTKEHITPWKGGIATFLSYVLIGFIPLIGYVFGPVLSLSVDRVFILACLSTLAALFVVGAIKSKFTVRNWVLSGIETAFLGGVAATIAYGIGYLLRGLAGGVI